MLLKCRVIGKQDPEEAKRILSRVASELIKEGKIKLSSLEDERSVGGYSNKAI